jgi:phenylalanyl-tRNA synthetase alpha chain
MPYLTSAALGADLAIRDLTDPASGPHAIQLLVDDILAATSSGQPVLIHRGTRIVEVADNYDRLGYSPSAAARDARYTCYVTATTMLRSQTSALIPGALRTLVPGALRIVPPGAGVLLACPGMVYRRDAIERLHTGTPHQLDLWRITAPSPGEDTPHRAGADSSCGAAGLLALVGAAVGAALPGMPWRTRPAVHPYTTGGLEIEAWSGEAWVEIGECGLAAPHILDQAGARPPRHGLAVGLGLDRLLMLRKGIRDIRLLRSPDPRVAAQMTTLEPYRPVPSQPAARRDLSLAMPAGVTAEDLGDRVRTALGPDATLVEEVTILAETPAADLPAASRTRLAIRDDEVNVLLRVILRDPLATLPGHRANALRDRIHRALAHPASSSRSTAGR